ncbi:MAG: hypothetical protein ABIH46_13985 [Chloroflexota bacterium]
MPTYRVYYKRIRHTWEVGRVTTPMPLTEWEMQCLLNADAVEIEVEDTEINPYGEEIFEVELEEVE